MPRGTRGNTSTTRRRDTRRRHKARQVATTHAPEVDVSDNEEEATPEGHEDLGGGVGAYDDDEQEHDDEDTVSSFQQHDNEEVDIEPSQQGGGCACVVS